MFRSFAVVLCSCRLLDNMQTLDPFVGLAPSITEVLGLTYVLVDQVALVVVSKVADCE
jgi:hypothetical protein